MIELGFKADVQQANNHGTKKITIPRDELGPNGEEIEIGDAVKVDIIGVEKQGERDD